MAIFGEGAKLGRLCITCNPPQVEHLGSSAHSLQALGHVVDRQSSWLGSLVLGYERYQFLDFGQQ